MKHLDLAQECFEEKNLPDSLEHIVKAKRAIKTKAYSHLHNGSVEMIADYIEIAQIKMYPQKAKVGKNN